MHLRRLHRRSAGPPSIQREELPQLLERTGFSAIVAAQQATMDVVDVLAGYNDPVHQGPACNAAPSATSDARLRAAADVAYSWPSVGGYVAFVGCLGYGMTRPEEAAAPELPRCVCPPPDGDPSRFPRRLWADNAPPATSAGSDTAPRRRCGPGLVEFIDTHVNRYGTGRGGTLPPGDGPQGRPRNGLAALPPGPRVRLRARRAAVEPPQTPLPPATLGDLPRLYAGVPPVQVAA